MAGALNPYLDLLPQSWRTPIMVAGGLATSLGPALFGPRGFNPRRRRNQLRYEGVFPGNSSGHAQPPGSRRK